MPEPAAHSLTDETFFDFATLIRERVGLVFNERNRYDLELGVHEGVIATKTGNPRNLYNDLVGALSMDKPPWQPLLQLLTVGETYFWRDNGQCEALRRSILPSIIQAHKEDHKLRIWSAGCSTGEEPYTLAIILHSLLPDCHDWDIQIHATDINQQALNTAITGVYGKRSLRSEGDREPVLRYLRPYGEKGEQYEVVPAIRKLVDFKALNLINDHYPAPERGLVDLDLILCRNVTIYFGPDDVRRVVNGFYETLRERGWLIVGHSEPSLQTYERFQPHNFPMALAYQKPGQHDKRSHTIFMPPTQHRAKDKINPFKIAPQGAAGGNPAQPFPLPRPLNQEIRGKPPLPLPTPLLPRQMPATTIMNPLNRGNTHPPTQVINTEDGNCKHEECRRADELIIAGDLAAASKLISASTAHCPKHLINLGRVAIASNNWVKAQAYLEEAITVAPLSVIAHYLLGISAHGLNNQSKALSAFKKTVYLDRHYALAHFHLATLYREMGDMQQAKRTASNAWRALEGRSPNERVEAHDRLSVAELRQFLNIFLK